MLTIRSASLVGNAHLSGIGFFGKNLISKEACEQLSQAIDSYFKKPKKKANKNNIIRQRLKATASGKIGIAVNPAMAETTAPMAETTATAVSSDAMIASSGAGAASDSMIASSDAAVVKSATDEEGARNSEEGENDMAVSGLSALAAVTTTTINFADHILITQN